MVLSQKEALQRAMNLCSRSEKSISDIRLNLQKWGIADSAIQDKIIENLTDNQFIDEKRYSRSYVLDKHRFNKWGAVKIRAMLRSKGINNEVIDSALESIDRESYILTLKEELQKKRNTIKATNHYDLKGKLLRFGATKGYETDLIYKVMDEIL